MKKGATGGGFNQDAQRKRLDKVFAYEHLPPELKTISQPFGELAKQIFDTLPPNVERSVALRKLLEAKDAAVRAHLLK